MSSPRDRDPFDDRPDDGSAWQEPAHLGDGPERDPRPPADQPAPGWEPPGWNLPAAEPQRPESAGESWRQDPGPAAPPAENAPPARGGGLFGGRNRRPDPEMQRAFTDESDPFGVLGWAAQQGWTVSDGTAPQDAPLRDLVAAAPVRPSKDDRPGNVLRGRLGALELVAFDIVYASGRFLMPRYAVTAVPMLGAVPGFRLSPARLWKHGIAGMVPVPSGNEVFDARWQLLAVEDSPQLHRLAADPAVQGLLLASDDGDEFWSAAGHVAAVRPDGHRPLLVEHHARLLTAIVGALGTGY